MAINTNPTGIFPIAQNSSDTPYKFLEDETVTITGKGIYIPFNDLEPYLPSKNVLDEDHGDADYRYLLLGLLEAHNEHQSGLVALDKPKGYSLLEGDLKTMNSGRINKQFTAKFFYDSSSLTLEDGEE